MSPSPGSHPSMRPGLLRRVSYGNKCSARGEAGNEEGDAGGGVLCRGEKRRDRKKKIQSRRQRDRDREENRDANQRKKNRVRQREIERDIETETGRDRDRERREGERDRQTRGYSETPRHKQGEMLKVETLGDPETSLFGGRVPTGRPNLPSSSAPLSRDQAEFRSPSACAPGPERA